MSMESVSRCLSPSLSLQLIFDRVSAMLKVNFYQVSFMARLLAGLFISPLC
ncbi:hypothetical protein HMPREF0083_01055 [Aneurinibacillus aneurinilyticus ATCC 12856]|uniref:Uncharacterized protein n=1 Tax=Aneurinibacillus aneurinilyticus ATCC 12856 TaxID=649747 RepID=U1YFK8_ANEAE|nr:hypothetical protein HMPREF0083_01055 [Aneurinibacillus aneurinilyticus ATCC 12856]